LHKVILLYDYILYGFGLKYLIKPLNSLDISVTDSKSVSNSSFMIYPKSNAKYNCERTSPADAFATYKK
jgi:hypothetical protein